MTNIPWFGIEPPFSEYGHARAVIIPAPYEGTVSYGKGAANGPAAIQAASAYIELYDSILEREVCRAGIHGLDPPAMPDDPSKAALAVGAAVKKELENSRFPVVVGGEHSLTSGAVRSALEAYPDLTVLQLDAHADLRDEYLGTKFSHACVMRRVADLGVPLVQAGVRSMSTEERQWLNEEGRGVISSRYILGNPDWINTIISSLSGHVYLTLDLDVLDPSEMPATGCPEPGGISYQHIIDLALALLDSGKQVVAMDMMELAPIPGMHAPDMLAASLLYTLIGAAVKA